LPKPELRKILLIAQRDYLAAIRTKAFLISLLVLPILFGGGFLITAVMNRKPDVKARRIAIVDQSGVAAAAVVEAVRTRNAHDLFDKTTGVQVMPRYEFETPTPDTIHPDAQRLQLSDRVRRKELFAFVEIQANSKSIAWYSNEGGLDVAQRWISGPLNDGLRRVRLARLGIDPSHFSEVLDTVPVESMRLVSLDEKTGKIQEAKKRSGAEGFWVPYAMVLLMLMIVLTTSGPMLTMIAEDKVQRVFEMLLASATPFELVAGKILAAIGRALTSSMLYVVAALFLLRVLALFGLAPLPLIPWFFVYVIAEITMLSAIATALGAACGSAQDAQSLALILMAPVLIPMFLMMPVLQQPNGPLATAASFFPLFTPFLMLLRQATPGGVAAWQPWVGLAGIAAATVVISWTASRIFRVAILLQGKAPNLPELLRWGIRG
jgi:ABC-2 type transport system permease protein